MLSEIAAELWAESCEWYDDEMRAKMLPEIEAAQKHYRQLRIQFETEKPHLEGASAVRNHPIRKALRPTTETPRDAYYEWLLQGLLVGKSEKFVASSTDGRIVRLGAGVFESYEIYYGPFPDTLQEQLSLYHQLFMGYFHLDTFNGTILPCADLDIIQKNGLEMSTRLIKPLEGWSICWKPKNFENWRAELRALLSEQVDEGTHVKRHSLADESRATATIVGLYDSDDQITKATCREFIGGRLGTLAFERAWAAAVSRRPALSRSGRRKSKPQI